ncbi:hypothetical protein F10086_182 [Staphylococcus phage vB_SauM_JDF86]|nr:hypothetical protein F10086_182 [Staphylococcus phage vB_SauM_JDF86]
MYNYLLFASEYYEGGCGMSDLVFKFNTADELQKEMENGGKDIGLDEYQDTFQIYDIKNDKVYHYITGYDEGIDGIFDDFINENL